MSIKQEIMQMAAVQELLKEQIDSIETTMNKLVAPLFEEQERIANKISAEFPQFPRRGYYDNPNREFFSNANNFDGYSFGPGEEEVYQLFVFSDGEHGNSIELLPEFLNGATTEEKEAAVRAVYQDAVDEKKRLEEASKQKRIDEARALLEKEGAL